MLSANMYSFYQMNEEVRKMRPRTVAERYWDRRYYMPKFGETKEILKERWSKQDANTFMDAKEVSTDNDSDNSDENETANVEGNTKQYEKFELKFIPNKDMKSNKETCSNSSPIAENDSDGADNILREVLRNDIELRFDKIQIDLKKLCEICNGKDPNEYIFEELCHCLNTNANVFYDSLLKALFVYSDSELKSYKKQINHVFKKIEWAHRKFYNIKGDKISDRFKKYLHYNSNVDFNMQKWTKIRRRLSHLKLYEHKVDNKKITLGNLRECVVEISGSPHMLFIKCVRDSIILCGPVSGSIFIEQCYDSFFLVAGKQLRIKYSSNCNVYSQIRNITAIEDCDHINFDKYNLYYQNIEKDFTKAGMNFNDGYIGKVVDFNWPNKAPSPNWTVVESGGEKSAWLVYKENLLAKIRKTQEKNESKG